MKTLKLILSSAILLGGIGTLFNGSPITGVLMLFLGIILFPSISSRILTFFNLWESKNVRYAVYLFLILSIGVTNKPIKTRETAETKNAEQKANPPLTSDQTCHYDGKDFYTIPGLIAADIYPNFESKGFKIEKQLSANNTYIRCELRSTNFKYNVVINGCSPDNIINVDALVIDYTGGNQAELESFFTYIASLHYTKCQPEKAIAWVKKNINMDGATTIIGDVMFSISFKSDHSKFLRIEGRPSAVLNNSEK